MISASFDFPSAGRLPLPRTAPRPFGIAPPPLVFTHAPAPPTPPDVAVDVAAALMDEEITGAGTDHAAVSVPTAEGGSHVRFLCAFVSTQAPSSTTWFEGRSLTDCWRVQVDNTQGVNDLVEAQIWVIRSSCENDEFFIKNERLCIQNTQKRGIVYQNITKTRNFALKMVNSAATAARRAPRTRRASGTPEVCTRPPAWR